MHSWIIVGQQVSQICIGVERNQENQKYEQLENKIIKNVTNLLRINILSKKKRKIIRSL